MSQTTSPEPKNWTIAYRKPRANRFVRAANWSGTWAEAVELSGRFGELHPDMQVWYTSTRQAELDGYVTVEDIANILTDTGKRIRVVEGELSTEDLAAMISPEADEAHAVLDHGISYDGRNSYPTPPTYLAPRSADSPAAVGDAVTFDQLHAKVIAVYPQSDTNPYAMVKIRFQATGTTETVARDAVRRDNWDRIQVLKSIRDSATGWTAEQEAEFYDLLGERYDRDGSHNLRQPQPASTVARDLDEAQHQANQTYLTGNIGVDEWRSALAAIEEERNAQARRLADETDALITELAEKYQIDGVPACGAPVDGGRCGRHPHHDGHPHIKEPGTDTQAEPPADCQFDKITLLGPAPWGGTYTARADDPQVPKLLAQGYTVYRSWTVVWRDGKPSVINDSQAQDQAEADQVVCAGCGERIFRHQDGTWDLVEKLQDDTRVCFIRNGEIDQAAYEDRQPHMPLTASGYDEGTPHFEVYAASPGGYDTKKHPTFIAQSMAEHNARRYSRDGRAYVVEGVAADGKRTKVAVFRSSRRVRQS